jgi:hypothetical protein
MERLLAHFDGDPVNGKQYGTAPFYLALPKTQEAAGC